MIVCCGEALIDMLPREIPGEGAGFYPATGGAVFNTAIALGRLGAKTAMFTGLGRDLFGEQLAGALAEAQVDTSLCIRSDRPCTLAFVILVNGNASYAFYDENTAGRLLTPEELPVISGAKAALFGGISLTTEPCASAYEALCKRLAGDSVIYIDPNIRPGFVRDAGAYRARLERMLALADIIKLSDEDLDWLHPGSDFEAQAQAWIDGGASLVLRTRGGEGAIAITRNGTCMAPRIKASVIDTVGAGDTFNAGILAGLEKSGLLSRASLRAMEPAALEPAMVLAAKAAAVTVSRAGANPPFLHEVE